MYADVIKPMDGARTIKEHITELQAILDIPPVDPQLASHLRVAISTLMQYQHDAAKAGQGSQIVRLNQTKVTVYRQLYSYCKQHFKAGKTEWMVAAIKAGWTTP